MQVFFVLSGYLITGTLLQSLEQKSGAGAYFRSFYFRRALRIFPVYFVYIAIAIMLSAWVDFPENLAFRPEPIGDLPYVLTYTYNLYKAFHTETDYGIFFGHLWSLSLEEQFYLLWPLLLFSLSRKGFVRLCLCLVVTGPLCRLLEAGWQWHPGWSHGREITGRFVYLFSTSHFDAFALGALVNFRQENPVVEKLTQFVSKYALWVFAALGGWMLLLAFAAKYNLSALSLGWPMYLPFFFALVWGYTVINSVGLALICNTNRWRLIGDFAPIRRLGRVSYGFYVFHYPTLWIAAIFSGVGNSDNPWFKVAFVTSSFALVWLLAEVSYRFLETPFMRLKSRIPIAIGPHENGNTPADDRARPSDDSRFAVTKTTS